VVCTGIAAMALATVGCRTVGTAGHSAGRAVGSTAEAAGDAAGTAARGAGEIIHDTANEADDEMR
jgi:hypothetical protein